jgi:hypothetical protein
MINDVSTTAEGIRLSEVVVGLRTGNVWGPYLSERQWGTVREDYSPYGNCWDYFPRDHARSRVYRWAKTAYLDSPIVSAGPVLHSHCGMNMIRS